MTWNVLTNFLSALASGAATAGVTYAAVYKNVIESEEYKQLEESFSIVGENAKKMVKKVCEELGKKVGEKHSHLEDKVKKWLKCEARDATKGLQS